MRGKLTETNTGKAEAADECTAATRVGAAIDQTSRARIARQQGQSNIILFGLQFVTKVGILSDSALLSLVACNPA